MYSIKTEQTDRLGQRPTMIQNFSTIFPPHVASFSIVAPFFHPRQRASISFSQIRTVFHFFRETKEEKRNNKERRWKTEEGRKEEEKKHLIVNFFLLFSSPSSLSRTFFFFWLPLFFFLCKSLHCKDHTKRAWSFPLPILKHPTSLIIRKTPYFHFHY